MSLKGKSRIIHQIQAIPFIHSDLAIPALAYILCIDLQTPPPLPLIFAEIKDYSE